jgi:hypothetical protein
VYFVAWCEKKIEKPVPHKDTKGPKIHKEEIQPSVPLGVLPWCEKKEIKSIPHKDTKGTKIHKEKIQPFVSLSILRGLV